METRRKRKLNESSASSSAFDDLSESTSQRKKRVNDIGLGRLSPVPMKKSEAEVEDESGNTKKTDLESNEQPAPRLSQGRSRPKPRNSKKEDLDADQSWAEKMHLKEYALLVWDGVGFFGSDLYKLPRLKGRKKLRWSDKCQSLRWIVVGAIAVTLLLIFAANELAQLGEEKDMVRLEQARSEFTFNLSEAVPLHLVSKFEYNDLKDWLSGREAGFETSEVLTPQKLKLAESALCPNLEVNLKELTQDQDSVFQMFCEV
jgi:hypothetical protein